MSKTNRAGAARAVTATSRNATAGRLLQASKQRQPAIAAADAALNSAFSAIVSKNLSFERPALRQAYEALRSVRRSAARVRVATARDLYASVTWGIPNQRLAAQFEDLAMVHAKTAMLMIATRGTLASEGDESITAAEIVAIDDNGVVADCAEENLSQAAMGARASRFSAIAQLASFGDDESGEEVASLTEAAAGLNDAISAAVADIHTPGDDVSDVTIGSRKADISTDGDKAAEKVRTNERDPNTPLDATAKKKKAEESTDGAGFPLSEREAAARNQARRKQADANDDLPGEPGSTDSNVDTSISGDPNDPEHGAENPSDGDASKGERPKFDAKARRKRADANDDLPGEPGSTDSNVDTSISGDPNDPEHGAENPSDGDASKGERPKFDAKARRKQADAWTQDENIPQSRPSASVVAEGGDDSEPKDKPASDAPKPAAPKPAAPAPAPAAPAPAAPAAPAPAPAPADLLGEGAPMVDPLADPSLVDPALLGLNPFGLQDQNAMDQILADEILGQPDLPAPDAGNGADMDPALVPTGEEVAGVAPLPTAGKRAAQRATKLASATPDRSAVASQDALLTTMITHDLLS